MKRFFGPLLPIAIGLIVAPSASAQTPQSTAAGNVDAVSKTIAREFATKDPRLETDIPKALPQLRAGADRASDKARAYFALYICYMFESETELGFAAIEKAYQLSPDTPIYAMSYGFGLKFLGRNVQARDFFVKLAAKGKPTVGSVTMIATLDMSIQDYANAFPLWKSLVDGPQTLSDLDRALALGMVGTCYLYRGDYGRAIDYLSRGVHTYPTVPDRTALGEALLKSGRTKESISLFDLALQDNPTYDRAHYYKGVALEKLGDRKEAALLYSNALIHVKGRIKVTPDEGENYFLRGLIETKLGNASAAKQSFEAAKKLGYTYEAPYKR